MVQELVGVTTRGAAQDLGFYDSKLEEQKGRGADLDERNARAKGSERPLPLLQITTPRLRKTDVI